MIHGQLDTNPAQNRSNSVKIRLTRSTQSNLVELGEMVKISTALRDDFLINQRNQQAFTLELE